MFNEKKKKKKKKKIRYFENININNAPDVAKVINLLSIGFLNVMLLHLLDGIL